MSFRVTRVTYCRCKSGSQSAIWPLWEIRAAVLFALRHAWDDDAASSAWVGDVFDCSSVGWGSDATFKLWKWLWVQLMHHFVAIKRLIITAGVCQGLVITRPVNQILLSDRLHAFLLVRCSVGQWLILPLERRASCTATCASLVRGHLLTEERLVGVLHVISLTLVEF